MTNPESLVPKLTADGSFTFFSTEFEECFHSHYGACQEAKGKFVVPTDLATRAQSAQVRILDICYGLGYNSAAALETIWQVNPHCQVHLWALEVDPRVPQAAIAHGYLQNWSPRVQAHLFQLGHTQQVDTPELTAHLLLGDARQTIQTLLQQGLAADAIFLDPFSPPQCPQLWTVEFLHQVGQCLHPQGYLATYSCAAAVRSGLLAAGLQIGSTDPVGRRSPGTVASVLPLTLPSLCQRELEHLQTRAAVPYRDPMLADSAAVILARRRAEQDASTLASTQAWKQRWMLSERLR